MKMSSRHKPSSAARRVTVDRTASKVGSVSDKIFNDQVAEYSEWLSFDRGRSPKAERIALRRIAAAMNSAAASILELFGSGGGVADETPTRAAWRTVNLIALENGEPTPFSHGQPIANVLTMWSAFASRSLDRVPPKRYVRLRLTRGADNLINVREQNGLSLATTLSGPMVADLVAIAHAAGDKSVTPDAAQFALKTTKSHRGAQRDTKALV